MDDKCYVCLFCKGMELRRYCQLCFHNHADYFEPLDELEDVDEIKEGIRKACKRQHE